MKEPNIQFSVLLVDDEPSVLRMLSQIVPWDDLGFHVCGECRDGEDALAAIRSKRPDLVLTDIRMPVIDGLALIRTISEMEGHAPRFVIISGFDDFSYARQAIQYQVRNYLLKPVDLDELATELKRLHRELEIAAQADARQGLLSGLVWEKNLKSLVAGEPSEETVREVHAAMGLSPDTRFTVLNMETKKWIKQESLRNDWKIHQQKQCLLSGLERHLSLNMAHFSFFDDLNHLIILLPDPLFKRNADMRVFSESLRRSVEETCDMTVATFSGTPAEPLCSVGDSYQRALHAMDYQYFHGMQPCLDFQEIQPSLDVPDLSQVEASDALLEAIENGERDRIPPLIHRRFQAFAEQHTPKPVVLAFVQNVLFSIIRLLRDNNANMERWMQQHPVALGTLPRLSLSSLEVELRAFSMNSAVMLLAIKSTHSKDTITQIRHYIDTHYQDHLSLRNIADKFYMSPVYLGQVFKQSMGVYFNDYLAGLRITEAKRLLTTTDMKIFAISQEVGYKDKDYFSMKFEELVGLKPSEYRARTGKPGTDPYGAS